MSFSMHDFEVQRCTRRCAATGRDLAPRETIYSKLVAEGQNFVRYDYSVAGWSEPSPAENVSWWKWKLPAPGDRRVAWAPHETLLQFFENLEEQDAAPERRALRFVLALLLVRRRIARIERTEKLPTGGEVLVLYSPQAEREYRVPVADPSPEQSASIRGELMQLLAAEPPDPASTDVAEVDSPPTKREPAP
jgi:hypothetical protein